MATVAMAIFEKAKETISFDSTDGSHPEEFMYEFFPEEDSNPVHTEDYGDTRWESHTGYVFKLSDGSYIEFEHASGLTESQDHQGIEAVDIVEPYEVTTVKYRSVK